jgi:hypothetical protein
MCPCLSFTSPYVLTTPLGLPVLAGEHRLVGVLRLDVIFSRTTLAGTTYAIDSGSNTSET